MTAPHASALPGSNVSRFADIDALRGFALLGVILVNAPFFAFSMTAPPVPATVADTAARWAVLSFATGKFFLIFSFLFGFGFAVLLRRSATVGAGGGYAYQRRLAGLMVLGGLHAVFLFFGDILLLYGVLGLVLWLLRGWTDRALVGLAVAATAVAVVTQGMVLTADLGEAVAAPAGAGFLGNFQEVTMRRLAVLPAAATIVVLFNGPSAFAMFLVGYVAARREVFPFSAGRRRRLRSAAAAALVAGSSGSGLAAAILLGSASGLKPVAAVVFSLCAPLLSFAMVVFIQDLAASCSASGPIRALAVAGRNTLSGYLLHSALLGWVFYGWGLGRYDSMGHGAVLLVAVLTFGGLVGALSVWARWFRYGPAEWLLRSFVELRWKRLLREAQPRLAASAGVAE